MNVRTVDIIVISVIGFIIAVGVITSTMSPGNKDGDNLPNGTNGSINPLEEKALAPASEPVLMDPFGAPVSRIIVNEQVLFQSEITNKQDKKQEFVYIVHITNSTGTVSLSWFRSELPPNEKFKVSQSWIPDSPGPYDVETFVWDSIEGKIVLSPSRKISVEVLPP
jgi:hypothetical protein